MNHLNRVVLDNIFHTHINTYANSLSEIEDKAKSMGLALTHEHWEVLNFVRKSIKNNGDKVLSTRMLCQQLKKEFFICGGYHYLYQLFPNGPVDTIFELFGMQLVVPGKQRNGIIY
ncbi:MAG: TusE/DsrC/DsvC family sulfur relay protein [Gammaproteobacteria bacterium]|nr:TusE/DsrC/DsvC family sulfur relay protein [Gammaproteobacteria bacterium]